MKPLLPISILVILICSSCASLPPLSPVSTIDTTICSKPFATGQQQFVHAIAASLPGGGNSLITGITTISTAEASVHAIIMTLEGLVLFEGRIKGGEIEILRSISVFSEPAFAEGLLNDVRLIFLKPTGVPLEIGGLEPGTLVCRYRGRDKSTVDVMPYDNGDWKLVQYDAGSHPHRWVRKFVPDRIHLKVSGAFSYSLDMQLIQ